MRPSLKAGTAALALAIALPAAAHAQDTTRRTFSFVDTDLAIDVVVDAPGVLRLIRGAPGLIEVVANTPDGVAAFGLADGDRDALRLTAVGSERVEYAVVVPAEVRVRVQLPDRPVNAVFGTLDDVATYSWQATPGGAGSAASPSAPRLESEVADGHLAYRGAAAPGSVSIPDPASVRTVTVRWEGPEFRVVTSRPLGVRPGDASRIELRPAAPGLDVVLVVPRRTTDFRLELGGAPALIVADGEAAALCTPVMDQRLDQGRRWFTFTPDAGRLTCRGEATPLVERRAR